MRREELGVLGKVGRIMLKLFVNKYDMGIPNGSIWIMTRKIGRLYDKIMTGLQT
jgi:hypothetical protein